VGDRGALPLLDAIGMDITFQELSLRGNNLRNKACKAVATMLKKHPTVSKVDLRDNIISVTGGQYLLDAVKSNDRIETMLIDNNRIPIPLMLQIQASLGGLSSIHAFASSTQEHAPRIQFGVLLLGLASALSPWCQALCTRFHLAAIKPPTPAEGADPPPDSHDGATVEAVSKGVADSLGASMGWLLYGAPCTAKQVSMLNEAKLVPDLVVAMTSDLESLVGRLAAQRVDPESGELYCDEAAIAVLEEKVRARLVQRAEDTEAVARELLTREQAGVDAVVEAYGGLGGGRVVTVDGTQESELVLESIAAVLLEKNTALNAAATQIQALQRGKAGRKKLTEKQRSAIEGEENEAT